MRALKGVVRSAMQAYDFPVRLPASLSVHRPPLEETRRYQLFGTPLRTSDLGTFYDTITTALYGGQICGNTPVHFSFFNGGEPFYADIFDAANKALRESKACNSTHTLVLKDNQRRNYLLLQGNHPDWTVSHSVYRHGVSGILSYKGSEHDLYKDLSGQTAFSVVLPGSVIEACGTVHRDTDDAFLTSRCTGYPSRHAAGREVPPSMRVSSRLVNLLFSNPREALAKLGLDPDRYDVNRYRTHDGMNIKRRDDEHDPESERTYFVKSFPVVELTDRDRVNWARTLGERLVLAEGCSDTSLESSLPAPTLGASPAQVPNGGLVFI